MSVLVCSSLSDYTNGPTTTSNSNGPDQLAQYEQYLRVELPRLVRNRLEVAVLGASEPLESQIRSQLVEIVRSCQSEAFRSYISSARPLTSLPNGRGGSSDPIQSLESALLPNDPPFDISAWFEPPSLLDPNLQIPSHELLQSSASYVTPNFSNFSDSGYGSYHFSFGDGMGSFAGLPTENDNYRHSSTAEDKTREPSGPFGNIP
jgi:hypothetical protein